MRDAIVQALPGAVVVAISPFAIVAIVLTLLTSRGHVNGPAFVLGWMAGLALLGALWLWVAGGIDIRESAERDRWISVALLGAGAVLLLVAVNHWRGRTRQGEQVIEPRWMGAFDTLTPAKAAGAGFVLSVSPKNLLVTFAGTAEIVQTGIPTDQQLVTYAVFVVIATMGIGAPVLIHLGTRDRAREPLESVKNWMIRHNAVIVAGLSSILGAKFIRDGISVLAMEMRL